MSPKRLANPLHGILLIVLFSFSACYIADFQWVKHLSFSPLIVGIVLGMIYANSLRNHLPKTWVPGIQFCTKQVLRTGIVLYGFKLTFQSVIDIGGAALLIDAVVVAFTILLGAGLGRLLKMDRDTALLTSIGSSICGAAAVLGAEPVVKSQPYKAAVAVSTVVIFGTLSMFLYPTLFRAGMLDLTTEQMGLFTGATLHEVAHVVGAGNAMGQAISDPAIIVKMIRVMMLAPVLVILSIFLFLAVIGFNSLHLLPSGVVSAINSLDTFLLTMAMTALGAESSFEKFKKAGARPFLLAALLYAWLFFGGYWLVKGMTAWMA